MSILEFIKVVILGIVEGITEWLPISSTGHMILVDEFIKMDMTPEFKEFFLCGDPAGCDPCGCSSVLGEIVAISTYRQTPEEERKPTCRKNPVSQYER